MDCTIDISVDNNSLSILGLNHPPLDCCSSVSVEEEVVLQLLCDMKVEARVIPTTSVVCKGTTYEIEKGCNIKLFKVDKNTIRSIWDEMKTKLCLQCAHIKYNEFDGSILEWLSNQVMRCVCEGVIVSSAAQVLSGSNGGGPPSSADVCTPAELVSCECCEWRGGKWVRRVNQPIPEQSNPNLIPVSELYLNFT